MLVVLVTRSGRNAYLVRCARLSFSSGRKVGRKQHAAASPAASPAASSPAAVHPAPFLPFDDLGTPQARYVVRQRWRTPRGPFNYTPMRVNSISPAPLHVRPMWALSTCRCANEIKKHTHPNCFTALFRPEQAIIANATARQAANRPTGVSKEVREQRHLATSTDHAHTTRHDTHRHTHTRHTAYGTRRHTAHATRLHGRRKDAASGG